jgi:IclR family acetate operon transcriptional repressor
MVLGVTMTQNGGGIQSLRRGLTILEAVTEKDLTSTEAAEILGVERTTAFRLLRTLMAEGYVNQDPATKAFAADPAKMLVLASKVYLSLNWVNLAASFLTEMRDATGETANLVILHGTDLVYVGQELSRHELSVRPMIGQKRGLHCSAAGKAVASTLDEDELNALIAKAGMPRATPHTIVSLKEFKSNLAKTRARGYAVDDQESVVGVRCVAAPLVDHAGKGFAAIGISGPVVRLTEERIPELGGVVREIAGRLSASVLNRKIDE